MAKYQKQVSLGGTWLKAADIKNGTKAKLVSETTSQPSTFLDKQGLPKTQDVAKIRVQGIQEAYNISINRATINALVDAFGEDSKGWMNKVLTIETEKVRVAGKSVTALYLLPDGYVKTDDDNGYAVITKMEDAKVAPADKTSIQPAKDDLFDDVITEDVDDVPFN